MRLARARGPLRSSSCSCSGGVQLGGCVAACGPPRSSSCSCVVVACNLMAVWLPVARRAMQHDHKCGHLLASLARGRGGFK